MGLNSISSSKQPAQFIKARLIGQKTNAGQCPSLLWLPSFFSLVLYLFHSFPSLTLIGAPNGGDYYSTNRENLRGSMQRNLLHFCDVRTRLIVFNKDCQAETQLKTEIWWETANHERKVTSEYQLLTTCEHFEISHTSRQLAFPTQNMVNSKITNINNNYSHPYPKKKKKQQLFSLSKIGASCSCLKCKTSGKDLSNNHQKQELYLKIIFW